MKKMIFLCLGLTLTTSMFSQNTVSPRTSFNRNSFWTETLFNGGITEKWRWQMDYQYRRESDASDATNASSNLFKNAYQHVYRPWIHYQLNPNFRFSLSPLGFWETFTPASESGGTQKIQPEFRICPQLTLSSKIGRIAIDQRYRYEYRLLGNKVANTANNEFGYTQGDDFLNSNVKNRVRYFVRATIPLGNHQKLEDDTFYITTWNEVFMSFGKNTNNDKIWDQNRTFCLLGYKPKMDLPMRFELGYGLQYANRVSSSVSTDANGGITTETSNKFEKNNILQMYVIFEDVNKLFRHKAAKKQ